MMGYPGYLRIEVMKAESHVVRHPSIQEGTHSQTVRVVRMLMVAGLRATRVNGAQLASQK